MRLSSASLLLSVAQALLFGIHWHAASVWASPTLSRRVLGSGNSSSFAIPISRRRDAYMNRKRMPVVKFNPDYAKEELSSLVLKYQLASKFLKGFITNTPHNTSLVNNGQEQVKNAARALDSSSPGAEAPLKVPPILAKSGAAKMPLMDLIYESMDILYYGPLSFGTPPQELTVDVDTGSADLWVPADCAACENKQFDKKASSTYSESGSTFEVAYGSGEVSAVLATDVVVVQGLSIRNQSFGAVTQESDDFNSYPNSGLLGMAFSSIAASGQPTFFENLVKEKQLAAPMFSVHLTRGSEKGSEVCFGCIDVDKMTGEVHWIPVVSKTYWSVALEHVSVDSSSAPSNGVIAAIDTGTTLIYLPQDIATKLYDMIPGSKPAPEYGPEFFTVPCDSQSTISFSFGGRDFAIDKSDFNLGPADDDSTDCVGGIIALGNDFPANLAIVGDEFLKSWYSTFDYSNGARVGFSPSVNNKT